VIQKPTIPKGTRDFLPQDVARRNYIFDTIKSVFKVYGFAPIETPSFELSSTLMGKYGEEGDRLIFRILNSGEKMKRADLSALQEDNLPRFANSLSEKALRYDLTVPFARFVVQHQNELTFPFKRYQIQAVWRADRPQHGRYQEFFQCDADVVGSDSLFCELELIQIFDAVLSQFNLPGFTIKINNRKLLSGIVELIGESEKLVDIVVAIDKLDKIGKEGVITELENKGISSKAILAIQPLFDLQGTNKEKLDKMEAFLSESKIGLKGVEELRSIFSLLDKIGFNHEKIEFDITLARGLNYYTGAIFEVNAHDVKMGSICGGGRYDDLTGLFGLKDLSGVGISFGADRIYDILKELDLFPKYLTEGLTVLFVNFGENESEIALKLAVSLRANSIDCEVYPSPSKMQKQLKYANDRGVKFVAIIGEEEMKLGKITLKNMESGEQILMDKASFINYFKTTK
jgi:histidyl-tRNA synthetase